MSHISAPFLSQTQHTQSNETQCSSLSHSNKSSELVSAAFRGTSPTSELPPPLRLPNLPASSAAITDKYGSWETKFSALQTSSNAKTKVSFLLLHHSLGTKTELRSPLLPWFDFMQWRREIKPSLQSQHFLSLLQRPRGNDRHSSNLTLWDLPVSSGKQAPTPFPPSSLKQQNMNLTCLWCHRAVNCRSLLSSARPVLCEGREGSTCQEPRWQRRQLRWPTMRTRSCGCGDARGETKRRISGKSEEAGALGQEPALQWQNTVLSPPFAKGQRYHKVQSSGH